MNTNTNDGLNLSQCKNKNFTFKLGNFFGSRENLHNEFKEFCIRSEICPDLLSTNDIKQILIKGIPKTKNDCIIISNFNLLVINSIQSYIEWYLPKYFCAFLNAQIKGNIYIGIDDYGEITGIPFAGDLDVSIINNMINNDGVHYNK